MYVLSQTFMHSAPGNSRAIISFEKYSQLNRKEDDKDSLQEESKLTVDPGNIAVSKEGEHENRILSFHHIGYIHFLFHVNIP